jgi:hypothetical protein
MVTKTRKPFFFPFLFLILQKETKKPWLSLSTWEDSNNKFHGKDKKMFVSLQGVCCALSLGTIALDPTFILMLQVVEMFTRFSSPFVPWPSLSQAIISLSKILVHN